MRYSNPSPITPFPHPLPLEFFSSFPLLLTNPFPSYHVPRNYNTQVKRYGEREGKSWKLVQFGYFLMNIYLISCLYDFERKEWMGIGGGVFISFQLVIRERKRRLGREWINWKVWIYISLPSLASIHLSSPVKTAIIPPLWNTLKFPSLISLYPLFSFFLSFNTLFLLLPSNSSYQLLFSFYSNWNKAK